jgi:PAS domain S-box-containing protein
MSSRTVSLTGNERSFSPDDIIVSKTDAKGRMTYVNDVFLKVSGYTEDEVLGQPHSMIRHPQMPRCVFKLLWDTIQSGKEIFAYVNNRAKNGDFYWVFAHVTPTFDQNNQIVGYHSSRRVPRREAVKIIEPIYAQLAGIESNTVDAKLGMQKSTQALIDTIAQKGISYDELMFTL